MQEIRGRGARWGGENPIVCILSPTKGEFFFSTNIHYHVQRVLGYLTSKHYPIYAVFVQQFVTLRQK